MRVTIYRANHFKISGCPKCRNSILERQWCDVCNQTGLIKTYENTTTTLLRNRAGKHDEHCKCPVLPVLPNHAV